MKQGIDKWEMATEENVIETDGGNTLMLTEEEFRDVAKKMPPAEFQAVVLDILKRFIAANSLLGPAIADISTRLVNHKAILDKLGANDEAEHSKVLEMAGELNEHTRLLEAYRIAWTENFQNLTRLVHEQGAAITAMRDLLFPPTAPPDPGPAN
jgi:hypothetical protein